MNKFLKRVLLSVVSVFAFTLFVNTLNAQNNKITVASAIATSQESSLSIKNTFDGIYKTHFNSKFGIVTDWPFYLDYTFGKEEELDHIIYYPRQDNGNGWGAFGEFEVWTKTKTSGWTKYGEFDAMQNTQSPFLISFKNLTTKPIGVRFAVKTALENRVSCGEMEFYTKAETKNKFDYSSIFTDASCSKLKAGVTQDKINTIPNTQVKEMANSLKNGTYDFEFRVQNYRPYQLPEMMSKKNKTSYPYSLRDNPTGIYVEKNDNITVMIGDTKGQNISMVVQNPQRGFGGSDSYFLQEGENNINIRGSGLIYIMNSTSDNIPLMLKTEADKNKALAKTVRINIIGGKVNGYFDKNKHTLDDWYRLLKNAVAPEIDALGDYSHLVWVTEDYRKDNTNILESLANFDRMTYLEMEFMGLIKYNRTFNNRMLYIIDYTAASPNATSYRTVYTRKSYSEIFTNPSRFKIRLWGPAHELGHMNQTVPGLKWTGTTEVTNNIYCLYVQQEMGVPVKLQAEGVYEKARKAIIETKEPHSLPKIQAYGKHELKLVPFWQIYLYLVKAQGQKDFYKDLFEHYRITDYPSKVNMEFQGYLQLDFVRNVCNISKINMIDFFEQWGYLRPVNAVINDYGNKQLIITQKEINDLKTEIESKKYRKPTKDVTLITDNNVDTYKK